MYASFFGEDLYQLLIANLYLGGGAIRPPNAKLGLGVSIWNGCKNLLPHNQPSLNVLIRVARSIHPAVLKLDWSQQH